METMMTCARRFFFFSFCSSSSSLLLCLLLSLLSANNGIVSAATAPLKFGINYGQIADNLPHPTQVSGLLRSLNVNRVKLYDADPAVLTAFAGTGVEFIVSNGDLLNMSDAGNARAWVAQNVQPFLPDTRITCVIMGNEVLSGTDTAAMQSLLPPCRPCTRRWWTWASTARSKCRRQSVNVLAGSYPPSAGACREDLVEYVRPLLDFHAKVGSPFLINAYPFFAYKASPESVSLPYVLFEPNPGARDPAPTSPTTTCSTPRSTPWTPLRPDVPVDVLVFALFNENMKSGPASERNYRLFYPNGTSVYDLGFDRTSFGPSPATSEFSSSSKPTMSFLAEVVVLLAAYILHSSCDCLLTDSSV
ncbi:hypothetical protein ZWY2020_044160 [Hordeum vulgare]|nr:hypothetical protein ZWY2020_044160 [Hordeum vulgare]